MPVPSPEVTESGLIGFVHRWFKLLAEGRWDEACDALDEDPSGHGIRWGPAEIRRAIEDSLPPGCQFREDHPEGPRFTDPDLIEGDDGRPKVSAFDDGGGFSLDIDVPLCGEWGPLTAQFEFFKRPGDYSAVLLDMHVL